MTEKPAPRAVVAADVIEAALELAANTRTLGELTLRLKVGEQRSADERKAVENARLALLHARIELLRVAKAFT